jgi:hypothetical protein
MEEKSCNSRTIECLFCNKQLSGGDVVQQACDEGWTAYFYDKNGKVYQYACWPCSDKYLKIGETGELVIA